MLADCQTISGHYFVPHRAGAITIGRVRSKRYLVPAHYLESTVYEVKTGTFVPAGAPSASAAQAIGLRKPPACHPCWLPRYFMKISYMRGGFREEDANTAWVSSKMQAQ